MIKMMEIINENKKFEYGCVMLFFDFPEMRKIQKPIKIEDIYLVEGDDSYGLETEPHTTLLYGLHKEVSDSDISNVLKEFTFGDVYAHNISLFENPDCDVLKFDIEGDCLFECNEKLKKFPYTTDFPDYHPHLTIAYLKPGTGKKYIKGNQENPFVLTPKYAIYSKSDKTKFKINIK
jgi:hypothetical protein